MDCCATIEMSETNRSPLDQINTNEVMADTAQCAHCGGKGRAVSRKTVLLMVKPELLERAISGSYSFCSERNCQIVYFDEKGREHFIVDDLRIRVGLKVKDDPVSLCYCFGFDEAHLREEIGRTGHASIPERISKLIREGLCACDTRNPAGVCCLGEVNKALKRLTEK
jgi:Zinc binding domain